MGYGKLARVTKFASHEHDEGTEEVAREPDYRDADDRCEYDCQHEEHAAVEQESDDDDDDDDEDDARAEQDAAADDDVDSPGDVDDDVENGSCARPRCCRCPRKFLVPRAVEALVAEATVACLLHNC